jgi:phosphate transport system permease protein
MSELALVARPDEHHKKMEALFRKTTQGAGIFLILLLVLIFFTLLSESLLSLKTYGFKFLFGTNWDPVFEKFGALPFVAGTLLSSFLALLISLPFSMSIALFLGEYFRAGVLSMFLKTAIELLAGIPSVIYGFWGLFALVPIVRWLEMALGVPPFGVGLLTAALVLAIMIVPYAASLGQEVIQLVPAEIKEAAYSLGATKYEVVRKVILPYARSGIFAGILLSLGRAIGETMAVTMVIGNRNELVSSIFSPTNTMASVIANELAEATSKLYVSTLVEIGLLLFIVTAIVNMLGKYIIKRSCVEI